MLSAAAEVTKLLDQIRALAPSEAVERASNQIEMLCRAYMEQDQLPALSALTGKRLEPNQYRIFNLLHRRRGTVVSRDAILDVMNHRTPDGPAYGCVSVTICRLRKNLVGTEYEGKIENAHGAGFRLAA